MASCPAHDLALGLPGAAEPEAPMTPGVIAEIMALVDDAPGDVRTPQRRDGRSGRTSRSPARAPGCPALGACARDRAVVEGERGNAFRSATAPDAPRVDRVGAPRVRRPERGQAAAKPERGASRTESLRAAGSDGRFATSKVSLPLLDELVALVQDAPLLDDDSALLQQSAWRGSSTRNGWCPRHAPASGTSTRIP